MGSNATAMRRVDPYHLLYEGGQFYLVGYAHERDDVRVFRLSRIQGKVAYATKAEHDFQRPTDFDPRGFAHRIPWQYGDPQDVAEVEVPERSRGTSSASTARTGRSTARSSARRTRSRGSSSPGRSASACESSGRRRSSTRRARASTP